MEVALELLRSFINDQKTTPYMTRCDDTVFYRVFCVTLLAIAFTFTIILTNVFIDIDGLLSNKKDKRTTPLSDSIIHDEFTSEATDNDDLQFKENDESYRTKRSIETQSFLFHIKNPKVKTVLANRLSTLLEELDAEESTDIKPKEEKNTRKDIEVAEAHKLTEQEKKKVEDDRLHLIMHNIMVQGIVGHMDMNDVFTKVNNVVSNFNEFHDKKDKELPKHAKSDTEDIKLPPKTLEEKFIEEMLHCHDLQEQIAKSSTTTVRSVVRKPAAPGVVIKTVIDIESIDNNKLKEDEAKISKGNNIKGIVELIYNGKILRFTHPDAETLQPRKPIAIKPKLIKPKTKMETTTTKLNYKMIPKSYVDKFVEEYFKRFPPKPKTTDIEHFEAKRLKRHVRVKYETSKETKKPVKKNHDDELYVEIETHFDSKGLKGEKKKKLIRNLIAKIQKALHSDMEGNPLPAKNTTQKHSKLHFRKRTQNPLEHTNPFPVHQNTESVIGHRQLNPISKTIYKHDNTRFIGTKSGEEWRKPFIGPTFLTASKSINSAEMGEIDADYSKVLDINGIPQRLQQPLYPELSEEIMNTNSYYDMGKMKYFIKDIDGSGFSVGFNQFVDEPPDSETMRLFTGLENVLNTYHQNYDSDTQLISSTEPNFNEEILPEIDPVSEHMIKRRSINKKHDYHSNEYKIIYDKDFMLDNNYRDIFETKKVRSNNALSAKNQYELPLVVDENVFDKNLKPAEIFGLANLLNRKKRSPINVKKISNLNKKIKLSRFLNTNAMSTKRIFLKNKKRHKRQINKIRIIATDLPHLSTHSDEHVFVVSDENVFADRAIVKEAETSESDRNKQEEPEYPYLNEEVPSTYVTKLFDGRSRHNSLMSKYPHVFMEEITRSREDYIPNNALLFGKLPGYSKSNFKADAENNDDKTDVNYTTTTFSESDPSSFLREQDYGNPLMAPNPTNYKVTVKIFPKNQTGVHSGFKEIHTSINKRFNKNGLLYSSLVNVSEISNIVKLNRSKDETDGYAKEPESILSKSIREQQDKMQMLLKQHAKHINEQLKRLNQEKSNLESLMDGENITEVRYVDYDDRNYFSKRFGLKNKEEDIEELTTVATTTVTPKPLKKPPLPAKTMLTRPPPVNPIHPSQIYTEKLKNSIITTIERNGNLTDQILKKIDKNTEILQLFLKKLTEKIPIQPITTTPKPEKSTKSEDIFPQVWANHQLQFNHDMLMRNDSHMSIPFVYAYQPPMMKKANNAPLASIVYHGHIHANTINSREGLPSTEKIELKHIRSNNQSRFFIDELENDYKVVQVGDLKKHHQDNIINTNGTLT